MLDTTEDEDGMMMANRRRTCEGCRVGVHDWPQGAKLGMVRKVDGWTAVIVSGCLEGIGELGDDHFDIWLEADVRLTLSFFSLS